MFDSWRSTYQDTGGDMTSLPLPGEIERQEEKGFDNTLLLLLPAILRSGKT
jgi:hypothetical protein